MPVLVSMYCAVFAVNCIEPLVDTFMRAGKSNESPYSIQAWTPTLIVLPETASW